MSSDPHERPTLDERAHADVTREVESGRQGVHADETCDLGGGPSGRDPSDGLRISGYEILGTVGSGGFGVVMRAREAGTQREVALKLLRTNPKPRLVERFKREGRAAAALDHPGIVRIHAAGEHRGQPWLAYELVEDCKPLDAAFEGADLRTCVGWVRDAARALGAAHAGGILHRDVKPDNLLVDGAGRLRVVDFGLAMLRGEERLTETNLFLGTPAYAAPEQVRDPKRVGPRADVWSLGVVLFQAMTGKHPLGEEGSPTEVLSRLLVGTIPRPRDVVPDVDPALERICLRAMTREQEGRYDDGEALALALDDWLAGRAPAERPSWALGAAGIAGVVAVGLFAAAARTDGPQPAASPSANPTASQPAAPTSTLKRVWSDDAAAIVERFVGAERLVVAADTELRVLRGANGALEWRADLPARATALASLSHRGSAFVFAGDAEGVGCWTAAGAHRWRRKTPGVTGLIATARAERLDLLVSDGQALGGFDMEGQVQWRLTAAWNPTIYWGSFGVRLLMTRNRKNRVRLFHLEMAGNNRLGRLMAYTEAGLGTPVLAALDPNPGLEVVLPSPGLVACRSASNERRWDYRVPGKSPQAPRLMVGPSIREQPPEVFVITDLNTIRLGPDGQVRRTYPGLDLRCVAADGSVVGLRGGDLVRLTPEGRSKWKRLLADAVVEVAQVRWSERAALLVRTTGRVALLDAATGRELGSVIGAARSARVERFEGRALLLIQRAPARLEAWQ